MVKKTDLYVISGSVVLIAILAVLAVVESPSSSAVVSLVNTPTANCTGVDLSFTYFTPDTLNAPMGTNTFGVILVNSTSNVNSTVSLVAKAPSGLNVATANAFNMSAGNTGYFTQYEILTPTQIGNYSLNLTLVNSAKGCQNNKSFAVSVNTVAAQNSTNSSA